MCYTKSNTKDRSNLRPDVRQRTHGQTLSACWRHKRSSMVGVSDESLLLSAAKPIPLEMIPLEMREQFLTAAVDAFAHAGPGTDGETSRPR
jgi:hypothetical protein